MSRSPALAATVALAAITLTACSGAAGTGAYGAAPAAPPKTIKPPPGIILTANSTAKLGTVVVDGLGFTLYRYDKDTANPPKATCEGPCAEKWRPVAAAEPVVLEGVDAKEVGSVERSDGTKQVTIGGYPVYRFAADPKPGTTDGHGKDGAWSAVTPEGDAATAP